MNAALASLLAKPEFVYHVDPSGVYQPCRIGMVLECSPGLTRAAFIHHANKGHGTLKHYAAIKGLFQPVLTCVVVSATYLVNCPSGVVFT